MPIQERVARYAVAHLRNQVVSFRLHVRLVTDSGHRASLVFVDPPPAQFLRLNGATSTVFLATAEFDRIHRLLQTESPVFYTAFDFIGPAFSLGTGSEAPGEGPEDDDALAAFMAQARRSAAPALTTIDKS